MSDLERLELALRRLHATRARAHTETGAMLNVDTQALLSELADEIAVQIKMDRQSR